MREEGVMLISYPLRYYDNFEILSQVTWDQGQVPTGTELQCSVPLASVE